MKRATRLGAGRGLHLRRRLMHRGNARRPPHRPAALRGRGISADPKPSLPHLRHAQAQLQRAPGPLERPAVEWHRSLLRRAIAPRGDDAAPGRTPVSFTGDVRGLPSRQAPNPIQRPLPGGGHASIGRSAPFRSGPRRLFTKLGDARVTRARSGALCCGCSPTLARRSCGSPSVPQGRREPVEHTL